MKLGQAIKTGFFSTLAIIFLVGMGTFIYSATRTEKTGRFNAQDMKEFYDQGYKDGADNMRQALLLANTDTTVKACQQR